MFSVGIDVSKGKSMVCIMKPGGEVLKTPFEMQHTTPPYQSGSFNATERHITKRGNRYLRKTGFEVMQSLIQHKPTDEPVFAFIEKKRSEGKCGEEAMIAGLNKFLRIYYGKITELYNSIDIQLNSNK